MAVNRAKAKQAARPQPPAPTPALPPAIEQDHQAAVTNGKKKKKKKGGKGRATEHDQHLEEDDMIPSLEPAPSPRSASRTGLSPDLESVHLSTTATLSATGLNPRGELLATANDLIQQMDADPASPEDEDYWANLPAHIKSFVRSTYSHAGAALPPGATQQDRARAQTMYALAQQMVQTGQITGAAAAAGARNGATAPGGPYPPGAYPSLPFDPSIFSDPAFNLALEQLPMPNNPAGTLPRSQDDPAHPQHQQPPYDEDFYSEDEVDENADEAEVEGDVGRKQEITSKKRNKKKKKKGGAAAVTTNAPQPAPPRQPQSQHTHPNAIPPPQAPAVPPAPAPRVPSTIAQQPPPSSRAAGKQPMSYAPSAPSPALAPPARSSRAASKAPAAPNPYTQPQHQPSPPSSNASATKAHKKGGGTADPPPKSSSNNKIWSTSSTEERERIKEFWLGLGESERRALVKVEKDAVLRKMKEQQKHSCSCAVCGRKRSAIEEELEVLYDAYYDELEQYANHQQQYASSGGTIPPPPGPGPFPGSVELDKNGALIGGGPTGKQPVRHPPARTAHTNPALNGVRGKAESLSHGEEYDDDGEEYEDEDEEGYDEEGDEEDEEEGDEEDLVDDDGLDGKLSRRHTRSQTRGRTGAKPNGKDFFNFGSSLTVTGPGNILTVADDLLKNDGQKFLEMMEQLAERRMQREEEAAADVELDSEEEEEDEDGEEDEEDEEDEEEDEEDEDEDEVMTEEQKMEEGKRMFSIFAARMFEQRVLQAYREKVAQERQLQLLRELEDETRLAQEKEARKQKENQKKKDKKKQQKQAKEVDKAKKDAEKAAEDAAARAKQEAHEEEMRKKREEERSKREAERKAKLEDEMRRAEEKRQRQAEQKALEAERRKEREEKERKAKEERAAKEALAKAEKAERERKAREEKNARDREEQARREKEREKERERLEQQKLEEQRARQAAAAQAANASSSSRGRTQPLPSSPRASTFPNGPKKILAKSPVAGPSAPRQPQVVSRSPAVPPPQRPSVMISSQPAPPLLSPQAVHALSPNPLLSTPSVPPGAYGPQSPGALSPRSSFVPPIPPAPFAGVSTFPPGPPPPPQPPMGALPQLAPSALPRNFGSKEFGYDPSPNGPPKQLGSLPTPIGPPVKAPTPSSSQSAGNLPFNSTPGPSSGHARRGSVQSTTFGAVQRPIARPSGASTTDDDKPPSGSSSRRTPSPSALPEGVLGSSALVAEDDEPILPTGRRIAPTTAPGWSSEPPPRPTYTQWPRSGPLPVWGQPLAGAAAAMQWNPPPPFTQPIPPSHFLGPPFMTNSPPPHSRE